MPQRLPISPHPTMADVELPRPDTSAPLGRLAKLSSPESPAYAATSASPGWPGPAPLRLRPTSSTTATASEGSSSGRGSSGGSDLASADLEPRVVSPADSGTAVSPGEDLAVSPRCRLASPADSGLSDGGKAEESCGSDDTVTPEYGDGDTSSVFSCDAEGYYTSFHIDSGLRNATVLPPPPPARPDSRSSTISARSSAATPRPRPPPPPRASSLDSSRRVTAAERTGRAERTRSPGSGSQLSGSETDTGEQFRSKTALTTGRIPSLCVVTPPASENGEKGSPERGRDAVRGPEDQMTGKVIHRGQRRHETRDHKQFEDRNHKQFEERDHKHYEDQEQKQFKPQDHETDSDRERTPLPEDGVGSGWVGDSLKAAWLAPLSDWTSSGDSSGGTPPLVRPEAEGQEHSGGVVRSVQETAALAQMNGEWVFCRRDV